MNRKTIPLKSGITSAMRRYGLKNWLTLSFFVIGMLGYIGSISPFLLGCLLFAIVLYDFQKRLDEGLPLIQLVGVLATLQWIIGPILAYNADLDFGRYEMRVGEDVYFSYALPGTAALLIGLYLAGATVRQRDVLRLIAPRDCLWMGLALGAVSLVGEIASRFGPETLQFGFLLLSQLRYVGALYLFRSRSSFKWPLIGIFIFPLFSYSAESAMFHDLLIWCGILFCYWFSIEKRTLCHKWVVLAVAAFFIFTLQSIKSSYRAKVWQKEDSSLIAEVVDFLSSSENLTSDHTKVQNIVRINQGWIIATVLSYVPDGEPYANGETVITAVRSALIPRFLDPDKEGAGGRDNFMRFTGLFLLENTSMGISPLGEAYANFGDNGGIIAMLVYGLSFALAVRFCFQFCLKHPHFIFWIPLIFYQAIKAETELVTVLNQITKGGLLAFGCYWIVHTWLLPYISSYSSTITGTRTGKGIRTPAELRAKRQIEMAREARRSMQASSPVECGNSR